MHAKFHAAIFFRRWEIRNRHYARFCPWWPWRLTIDLQNGKRPLRIVGQHTCKISHRYLLPALREVFVPGDLDLWPPKWEKTCPDSRPTHMQNFTPLSISAAQKSVTVQTKNKKKNKNTHSKLSIPPYYRMVGKQTHTQTGILLVPWHCWLGDRKGIWPEKTTCSINPKRFTFGRPGVTWSSHGHSRPVGPKTALWDFHRSNQKVLRQLVPSVSQLLWFYIYYAAKNVWYISDPQTKILGYGPGSSRGKRDHLNKNWTNSSRSSSIYILS